MGGASQGGSSIVVGVRHSHWRRQGRAWWEACEAMRGEVLGPDLTAASVTAQHLARRAVI
jgi:hypothetical protein